MTRNVIAIVLSIVFLAESALPLMELHELSKVPALMEHFEKHKKENPGITFLAFLALHYSNTEHHEQDQQAHHQLPFSHHHHTNCTELQATFVAAAVNTPVALIPLHDVGRVVYAGPCPSSFNAPIWQPPKIS